MIKINLLSEGKRPVAVRKKKAISVKVDEQNLAAILLLVGLIPGLLGAGVYWWMLKSELQEKRDIKVEREQEYERLKPIIAEVEEFKKKQTLLEQKIAVIQGLRTNQRGPVQVMDYISRALPEMVWLERLEVQAAVIRINGRATNENAIANFIDNLDKVEEFQEPVLRQYRATNDALFSFEISVGFQLRHGEEGEDDLPEEQASLDLIRELERLLPGVGYDTGLAAGDDLAARDRVAAVSLVAAVYPVPFDFTLLAANREPVVSLPRLQLQRVTPSVAMPSRVTSLGPMAGERS